MKRTLVVSYSRDGTTRRVAHEIAEALSADFDPIRDVSERSGPLGYIRSAFESAAKGLPSIRTGRDPGDYELVVLGTPVWMGTMASPVRSYLFLHGKRIHRVALFCTMRGRGALQTLAEMKALLDAPDAPTFFAREALIRAGGHTTRLGVFTEKLQQLAEAEAEAA